MKYLKYLWYLIKHKWFVMLECFKVGLYWQGITHDLSKFFPDEFFPYARHDWVGERDETGYYKAGFTGDEAFDYAWLLHQKRNKHHWQNWLVSTSGKWYNASICHDTSKPIKIENSASVVDLNVLYRIFRIQRGNIDFSVKNTGKNIVQNREKKEENLENNRNMIKNAIGLTLINIGKKLKEKMRDIGKLFWNIMVVSLRSVLVVVNPTANFCVLTILAEEGTNIERKLTKMQELLHIVGSLKRDFQKDFVSFVPIAIRHTDTIDTALTTVNKDFKILKIPLKYRLEMLCDWKGAGRAQGTPDTKKWWKANKYKLHFHSNTERWFDQKLK